MSLPSGYKKLEYIQSSGTQYIDTGFKPNQSTKIELDVLSAEGTSSNIPYIFGTQDRSNNYFVATWVLGYGSGMVTTGINLYDGKFHVVKVENGALYKDGSIIAQRTVSSFSIGVPIFLFAVNSSRQSMGYGACKLRSCKIYDNGTLVRDFIPCKNASGVVGMWDDVNSVFYQNAGSGTFTSGPEIKGANKTLIDGTGYDVNAGKCLVGGTAYAIKKGRTLIGGTGYDIKLKSGETWYLNSTISLSPMFTAEIQFVSNGQNFSSLKVDNNPPWSRGVWYDTLMVYGNDLGSGWGINGANEVYRTITFEEELTGDLLAWLQANGTQI